MITLSQIALAFLGGIALGIVFYGGLRVTLIKILKSRAPALFIFVSFILRTSITLVGFYFFSRATWQPMIFCLVGFMTSKFTVTYLTRPKPDLSISNNKIDETQS